MSFRDSCCGRSMRPLRMKARLPGSNRSHCLVDEYDQVLGFEPATIQRRCCGPCLGARLAGCKKGMDATVITLDVVSSILASREYGLLLGDAREVLRTLAEDSVDCTV